MEIVNTYTFKLNGIRSVYVIGQEYFDHEDD